MTPVSKDEEHGGDRRSLSMRAGLAYVGALLSIIAFAFTAGVEWNKVAEVGDSLDKFQKYSEATFVRKDVAQQELNNVLTKLDEMNARLADLQQRRDK